MTGHIRQRSPGSWEIKFDAVTDPATGKRKARFVTVRGGKKDAQRELRRRLGALDEGRSGEPSKFTVAQYLEHWLDEHAKHKVSAKTFERYAEILRLHAVPVIGGHPLARLEPLHIQACHGAMRERNPADAVDAPRVAHSEMKILDQAQSAALLRAAEGSSIYAPVLLAVTTACGEARSSGSVGRMSTSIAVLSR
jgi:hypothetical protein